MVDRRLPLYWRQWFKTIPEARLHILDLAAYIYEEELRIAAV